MTKETSASQGTADMYRLFASVFAKEPTTEFLLSLQEEEKTLPSSEDIDPLSGLKHFPVEEQAESIAIEYAGLFLVPGTTTSPRESIQRGEGRLWGESTVRVSKIYRQFGFELDDSFKDTPDHLSVQLSFLAELSALEVKYENEGLLEVKKGVLEVKKYFLKNHLWEWFPDFEKEVDKCAKLSYYQVFASLLDIFLNEEWESLQAIKNIS